MIECLVDYVVNVKLGFNVNYSALSPIYIGNSISYTRGHNGVKKL